LIKLVDQLAAAPISATLWEVKTMAVQVNIAEAKAKLSSLLDLAITGERSSLLAPASHWHG
jgi:hypothetical protein